MAYGLTFGANTSDRDNHGSAAGLDNLSTMTVLQWVRVTTLTDGRTLWSKANATATRYLRLSGTGGNVQTSVSRAGVDLSYITNDTPLSSTGTSACIAVAHDIGASAGQLVDFYKGLIGTAMAESTYGTATDGDSGADDDSGADFSVGNRGAAYTMALQGDIYLTAIYAGKLSSSDIEKWRLRPVNIVLGSSCLMAVIHGNNGSTGSQVDLTGNGNNGTVTGATAASTALALALHGRLTGGTGTRSLLRGML